MEIFCISLSLTIKVNLSHEDLEPRNSLWSGADPSGSLGCETKHEHKTFTLSMETSISALKCGDSSTFATFQLSYFPTSQPGIYRKQSWAVIRIISTGISTGFQLSAGISKHCYRGGGDPYRDVSLLRWSSRCQFRVTIPTPLSLLKVTGDIMGKEQLLLCHVRYLYI